LNRIGSGRTSPAIFGCEDSEGNPAGEFVVKFKSGIDTGVSGLTCELIASLVADQLGLSTPNPAIVELDPSISDIVPGTDAGAVNHIRKSGGLNFGTEVLVGGFRTWPVDKAIPYGLLQTAVEVFAFDALTQNPDRGYKNPNLLWRDEEIYLIDHEATFSFLYAIGASGDPWRLEGLSFLNEHVFYHGLKGKAVDLDRFTGALEALSDGVLSQIAEQVPSEWNNDNLEKIIERLRAVRNHAGDFAEQVKRRLV
jgi:HipA-like kinase